MHGLRTDNKYWSLVLLLCKKSDIKLEHRVVVWSLDLWFVRLDIHTSLFLLCQPILHKSNFNMRYLCCMAFMMNTLKQDDSYYIMPSIISPCHCWWIENLLRPQIIFQYWEHLQNVLVMCTFPFSCCTDLKAKRRVTSVVGATWLLLSALRWSEILACNLTRPWN